MPKQSVDELKEAYRRALERFAAVRAKKKARRQAQRAKLAAYPIEQRAMLYELLPQPRRHLAKLVRRQRRGIATTKKQLATADEATKQKLSAKLEKQIRVLAGLVASLKAKRMRQEGKFVPPAIPALVPGKNKRESLPMPVIIAPPSEETVAMILRLVGAFSKRAPDETDDMAYLKVQALAQRGLARYLAAANLGHAEALKRSMQETIAKDLPAITRELREGGFRSDPVGEAMQPFLASHVADIACTVEDLQRSYPAVVPAGEGLLALFAAAQKEEASGLAQPEKFMDEFIQDLLYADEEFGATPEKAVPMAKTNSGYGALGADEVLTEDSTPLYKNPWLWAALGAGYLIYTNRQA